MSSVATTVAALILLACAIACGRVARWHAHERDFWLEIATLDRLGLAPADAPSLLAWVQTHDTSVFERIRGWRAPHVRRRAAQ